MSRGWEAAGWAVLAAAAAAPVADTDLWWHLSAGLRVLSEHGVPRADWLSWTLAGAPWTDFEWLAQGLFAAAHLAGDLWGLWLVKALLLACAGAGVLSSARAMGLAAPARGAALALFAAAALPRADMRTELFSLAAFAWLMAGLEGGKLKPIAVAALFAAWANLHAGFPLGLALVAAYGRWALLVPALLGTFLTPYGPRVWSVLAEHGRDAGALGGLILEWGPLGARSSHAGAWALVLAAAGVAALSVKARRAPSFPASFALVLAACSVRHARLCGYAAACAPLLFAEATGLLPGLWGRGAARRALAGLCAASLAFVLAAARPWRGAFDPVMVPERASKWLASHPGLKGRKLYNPWSWGGYLGFTLRVPVFQDGRYLFHGLLREQGEAVRSPEAWQAFLYKQGVELAVLENLPLRVGGEVTRPYYFAYMPRERWALVWFDDAALVFLRRDLLGTAPEYRWLRPRDEEALARARAQGQVDEAALEAERRRYAGEFTEAGR